MSIEPSLPFNAPNSYAPFICCVFSSLLIGGLRLGPVLWNPSDYLIGGWGHPDNIGNHWLLVWVAERLWSGESLIHNAEYYVPIGDHPWLAGNGTEGLLYALFHPWLGWPTAVVPLVLLYFVGMGLGGYGLGRVLSLGRWASLIPSMVIVSSGFWTREINAGRFSQLDGVWLIASLALFVGLFTGERRKGWATLCGVTVGLTGIFYWYYAYFFVLAALVYSGVAVLLKPDTISKPRLLNIGLAMLTSWVVIAPVAWVYWQHWGLVPGVEEVKFPSADAFSDALTWSGSWLVPYGRTAGAVQSIPTLALAIFGCVSVIRHRNSPTTRFALLSTVSLCGLFGLLAFGPKTPLFEWVYGWSVPVRRFWWPSRHLLLWTVGWGVLAGLGGRALLSTLSMRWRPLAAIVLALSVPGSLWVQGDRPFHANHTPIEHPVSAYQPLTTLEGEGLWMHPLNPAVANTQLPLLLQLTHGKKLLNGHGMWVDRVRPTEWDEFVDGNALLKGLSEYELGAQNPTLNISASDIDQLVQTELELIVLDSKLIPRPLMGLVPNLAKIYGQLFGEPVLRGEQLRVWSVANWTGVTVIALPSWTLPSGMDLGNGRHRMPDPVVGRGVTP